MKILAIETSCDETAASVTLSGRQVLSSVIYSQVAQHSRYGGVVPEIASRCHVEQIVPVTQKALEDAGCGMQDIGAVAVTSAPGLIGALLVGVNYAKGLAFASGKPLIPVHHIRGHVAANYIAHPELTPPFLCLIASGGHSHIVEVRDYTEFTVIGRTRDDAAGEAYDKAARIMGLGYPGGVALDKVAQKGTPGTYPLPTPCVEGHPYDFSFSGLKTAVINIVHNARQKQEPISVPDLAASFQDTAVHILANRLMLAADRLSYRKLALAGGVSANSGLRRLLRKECAAKGYSLYMPPLWLCGDNAAMIGAQAYYEYQAGTRGSMTLNARATADIVTG